MNTESENRHERRWAFWLLALAVVGVLAASMIGLFLHLHLHMIK